MSDSVLLVGALFVRALERVRFGEMGLDNGVGLLDFLIETEALEDGGREASNSAVLTCGIDEADPKSAEEEGCGRSCGSTTSSALFVSVLAVSTWFLADAGDDNGGMVGGLTMAAAWWHLPQKAMVRPAE